MLNNQHQEHILRQTKHYEISLGARSSVTAPSRHTQLVQLRIEYFPSQQQMQGHHAPQSRGE